MLTSDDLVTALLALSPSEREPDYKRQLEASDEDFSRWNDMLEKIKDEVIDCWSTVTPSRRFKISSTQYGSSSTIFA